MGTFRTPCTITNVVHRGRSADLPELLVDTGSEYTWVPAAVLDGLGIAREKKDLEFVMANGQRITRSVGFAIVRIEPRFTVDEVVFAEPGDLLLLGARTLEGLNLTVDARQKTLVAAGPLPAASAWSSGLDLDPASIKEWGVARCRRSFGTAPIGCISTHRMAPNRGTSTSREAERRRSSGSIRG